MDGLDFTASIVRSLSWPVALCFVAWLLRSEVKGLFGRLERIKAKDVEASFTKRVEEAAEFSVRSASAAEAVAADADEPDVRESKRPGRLTGRFTVSAEELVRELADEPRAAIVSSWEILLSALSWAESMLPAGDKPSGTVRVSSTASSLANLTRLRDRGVLSPDDMESVLKLRELRDEVARGFSAPSASAAFKYAETVDYLAARLSDGVMRWAAARPATLG